MQSIDNKLLQLNQLAGYISDVCHILDEEHILELYSKDLKKSGSNLLTLVRKFKESRNLQVAVVGNYNSGKSTFINSLIGLEVSVTGDNPTTSSATRFSKSETEQIFFLKNGSLKEKITRKRYEVLTQHKRDKNEKFYEFEYFLPEFPFEEVDLIDTPGFTNPSNSGESGDDENTIKTSQKADIIFFLMEINDGNLGADLIKKIKEIDNGNSKKCYLIISQADLKAPGEIDRTLIENKKLHSGLFSEIFIYSSIYGENRKIYFDKKKEEVVKLINGFGAFKYKISISRFQKEIKSSYSDIIEIINYIEKEVKKILKKYSSIINNRNQKIEELRYFEETCKSIKFNDQFFKTIYSIFENCLYEKEHDKPFLFFIGDYSYKWNFDGDKFTDWIYEILIRFLENNNIVTNAKSRDYIGRIILELVDEINYELEEEEPFTKSNNSYPDFREFILKYIFYDTILVLVHKFIKKMEKESELKSLDLKESSIFEDLQSLIKKIKKIYGN
jgi:GTPase Era involved in 16S rRNA processing